LDIIISKGCAHRCTFCNEPFIWGAYRPKSKQRIFEEIKYYVEKDGISQFELGDNSFTTSSVFLKALEELSHIGINVQWSGNCRINELNTKDLINFHQMGLTHCYFGMESASPKILQLMGKQFEISRMSELLKICYNNQIKSTLYILIGFPSETSDDFTQTISFIETYYKCISDILVSIFTLMSETLKSFTYQTTDGVTHEMRKTRFLKIRALWENLKVKKT